MALLVLMPLALRRLGAIAARHRRASLRAAAALAVVWSWRPLVRRAAAPAVSTDPLRLAPFASTSTAAYAYAQVSRIPVELPRPAGVRPGGGRRPLRHTPAAQLLTSLRGKDVLFVFVESYGRVGGPGSTFAPGVDAVLDDGHPPAARAGFGARSAFLTSPTFGGDQLARALDAPVGAVGRQPAALRRAGQQPPADVEQRCSGGPAGAPSATCPANTHDWPQGAFYGYDTFYDSRNVGYAARGSATRRCPTSTPSTRSTGSSWRPATDAGDGGDRPDLQPRTLVADAAHGRPGRRRRRLGVRRDAASGCPRRRSLALAGAGAGGVRAVDRVLADSLVSFVQHYGNDKTVLVAARRPPAGHHRLGSAAPTTTCRSR